MNQPIFEFSFCIAGAENADKLINLLKEIDPEEGTEPIFKPVYDNYENQKVKHANKNQLK